MAEPFTFHCRRVAAALGRSTLLAVAGISVATAAGLQSLDLEDLLKVRVVGATKHEQAQGDVPAAVAVITREEIQRFGWRTLSAALRTLPGVYSTYDRQYEQTGTRGLGLPGDFNTRLLVTINGNRVNDPVFDGAPTGHDFPLDMDLVERIEFIPGPGSAIYGQNAMLGVVNVVTRSGAKVNGAEASVGYEQQQALHEGRLTWGGLLDNGVDVLVSLSGLQAEGRDLPMSFGDSGIRGIARGLDGERIAQAFVHASSGAWQFEWTHGSRIKDDPTGAYLSDPLVAGQYQKDMFSIGQLRYQTVLARGWDLSARLFGGAERYDSTLFYGTQLKNTGESDWWGTEWQLSTTLFTTHRLQLGLEYQSNWMVEQVLTNAGRPADDFEIETPSHRLGISAQDEWQIRPSLAATIGLRADRNADGSTRLNPRAALIWQPTSHMTLKTLLGTAHRQPNSYESAYDDGVSLIANPHLHREQMKTAEIVADHRVSSDLLLHASVYRWLLQDVIMLGQAMGSDLSQYQNGPQIYAEGFELGADRSWAGGTRLRGNVSFNNETLPGTASAVNSPRWMARSLLSMPLPVAGLQWAWELRYDDRRRTYAGTLAGGNLVTDVRLSTTSWIHGTEVALKLANLFDRHYVYPAADTNWQSVLEQDRRNIAIQLRTRF